MNDKWLDFAIRIQSIGCTLLYPQRRLESTTLLHLLKQNVRSFLSDYRRMEETGNLNSGLFFYIFKSVTRCKYLDMLIEGRIGTRAGSEHYGQHDKKIV